MARELEFVLNFTDNFKKGYKKVTKNEEITKKVFKSLEILKLNPYHPSLKTHKFKEFRSSWVTGDLRIIWQYSKTEIQVLDLLDIGGHSGNSKVY